MAGHNEGRNSQAGEEHMVRRIEKSRYLMAALFAVIIFSFGLSVGMVAENRRIEYMNKFYQLQSNEYESLQLQYLYLTTISNTKESCPVLQYSLDVHLKHLEDTRIRLENYKQDASSMSRSDFDALTRQYLLAEIKSWLFTRTAEKVCNETNIVTILNFHSKNCIGCEDEAMVLSYFKALFKEKLLIFSFDLDYENELMVNILRKSYNVTIYPTLIVDDEKYEDFVSKDQLKKILCSYYGNITECE